MANTQLQRWADPQTQSRFPGACKLTSELPLVGNTLTLPLPKLASGDLLVPSFAAQTSEPYEFQFSLNGVELPPVPSQAPSETGKAATTTATANTAIRTHLDWFEATSSLHQPVLTLQVRPELLQQPHLLSVSVRPVTQTPPASEPVVQVSTATPPSLSQRLADPGISGRICSPTAVAMVLAHHGQQIDWLQFVAKCRDPASGMYGLWPLCILRAAEAGCLGAVQAFSGWHEVTPLLEAGLPLVASIRYQKDQLPGSPMPSTGGHLVVVFGVDAHWVLVNDPAARDNGSVTVRYPRAAFAKAWFEHRGAGYLLLP